MHDLKVNISGPKDNAHQTIHFNVRYSGRSESGPNKQHIQELLGKLKEELRTASIGNENARRLERNFQTIDDETNAIAPSLKEVESALGSVGRILESVNSLSPTVITVFRTLAAALGFAV
jgi:hypothetical protein